MPRLIRRRPLGERIRAYLDPADFLLWLSEELDSGDWDQWQGDWATLIGLLLNVAFLIARANSGYVPRTSDDVFGDDVSYTSWSSWLVRAFLPWCDLIYTILNIIWQAAFIVHFLSLLSFLNAGYTFYRQRHYRLFESNIENGPSTPSAHRVRVDSSPVSSSPLRFLSNIIAGDNAESRSHPDAARDVWEIAVWDPTPLSLRIFCLFSPGHVLVYWLFLPANLFDPRPSVTVLMTIMLGCLLSAQLYLLQSNFSQQSKDSSIIHKEVMNEYDTKFVHPLTQPLMRDVGTQFSTPASNEMSDNVEEYESVDTYTPTFIINKGFHTRPNPNYFKHVDPAGSTAPRPTPSRAGSSSGYMAAAYQTPAHLRDTSSPIRPQTATRQPQFRVSSTRDGGSLGVFSHANSPLKKSASMSLGQRDRAASPVKRDGSPLKRSGLASIPSGQRFAHYKDTPARRENGRF